MKRPLTLLLICSLLLILGFVAGRVFQKLKHGYFYEVREQRTYPWKMGELRWQNVTESVGLPFLDPGTTILEFNERTIYNAKRGFQENVPFADNVKTSDNMIEWDDGEYRFRLNVEPMPPKPPSPQPNGADSVPGK
jgi:hypothetical protein